MSVKWKLRKLRTVGTVAVATVTVGTALLLPTPNHPHAMDDTKVQTQYLKLDNMKKKDVFEQTLDAEQVFKQAEEYKLEQERLEEERRLEEQRRQEEEQRRLAEEQRQREEQQRQLEEQRRQEELARQRAMADTSTPRFKTDGTVNPEFRQTIYDVVQEGGVQVSHGEYWNSPNMRVHNNLIQYYDNQYGWVQVVALNIDQVKEHGSVVTSEMLGSIIEMRYPNGEVKNAIVLDVCGAARTSRKVDLWVYDFSNAKGGTNTGDIHGVEFRFVRFGM